MRDGSALSETCWKARFLGPSGPLPRPSKRRKYGIEFDHVDAALIGVDEQLNSSCPAQPDEAPSVGILALDERPGGARMDGKHVM